jgi:transposase
VESEDEMPRYTEEFKEKIVQKMMPPNAMSVADVNREVGISTATLYNWRNQFRSEGNAVPADPSNPENWSGENKLAVVIESAGLNEQELSEYCRRKGLYAEQIARWREAAIGGNESPRECLSKPERQELQKERKKSRSLEKELARKEKALAEAAALLVLQKKSQAIWGEEEDE